MQSHFDTERASVATAHSHSTRYLPVGFAGNKKIWIQEECRRAEENKRAGLIDTSFYPNLSNADLTGAFSGDPATGTIS